MKFFHAFISDIYFGHLFQTFIGQNTFEFGEKDLGRGIQTW